MVLQKLRRAAGFSQILPNVMSGLIFGITEVVFSLSFGSLIFSGELEAYRPYGIALALITSVVMLIMISLTSRVPGVIGSLQDIPSVILGVIAGGLAGATSVGRPEERLVTILAAITATTLLTGVFCLALGYFKLGQLMRFIPYTVVGGFLAGTGWLLVAGSFGVMTDLPLSLHELPVLLQPNYLILWVPGVFFAIGLFVLVRRVHHFLIIPGSILAGCVLYYLVLAALGISYSEAVQQGFTLGEVLRGPIWQFPALSNLLAADWTVILGQSGNIAVVIILSAISLLLNASALEVTIHQDVQLNRELVAAGFANILSGLAGGMVGYHALSLSSLSHRIGARGRLPGIIAGIMCAVLFLVGGALLMAVPKSILGGLSLFLGIDFLYEWVVASWSRLSRSDYAVVLLILVVIATTNFIVGVGVGLAIMILLFIVNYSRINIVHKEFSGFELRSTVERRANHLRILNYELGGHIYILELQGYLFFGTANSLLEVIRTRLNDPSRSFVRYLILDFRRVSGLDTTAALSFVKIRQIAEVNQIHLVLTHLSEKIQQRFELDVISSDSEGIRIFPDLDHGLEWCEDELLRASPDLLSSEADGLSTQLSESGLEGEYIRRLLKYLEKVEAAPGEILMLQGEPSDSLYFIEQGSVSVYLRQENGMPLRLRSLGRGTSVGELGFYLRSDRTASVVTDTPVVTYRLRRDVIEVIKQEDPELAAAFHEYIACLLSRRLDASTHTLENALK